MRTPLGGRTYEAYGEDPFLNSRLTVGWIEGAQSEGEIADVKHYAANNQEGQAGAPPIAAVVGGRQLENDNIDERTLREVYLQQFEAAVKEANVGTVMCAYNQVGGQYACENQQLLQQILEAEWGFKGFVLADYGADHNTIASLNNGLDFEPWPGVVYGPTPVKLAVTSGQVSQATIDAHLQRILRTLFAFGFFDRAAYTNNDAQIDKPAHAAAAERIEEAAVTLLKNQDGVLPLNASKLHSIAVIGPDANRFVTGNGSGSVTPFSITTPLQGIAARVGPHVAVHYDDGSSTAQAQADARSSEVAVVLVGDYETEGADRPCMGLNCSNSQEGGQYATLDKDALVSAVAAANPNTIVVLETGAPVLTPWRDQVRGLVEAWYPGEQGGTAIARTLFGDADPSGRLPATFPQQEGDIPTAGDPAKYPGLGEQVFYKEGIDVGYRWYDANNLVPAFPFGFGLSYTSFAYRGLQVAPADANGTQAVSFTIANTGRRTGTEVPQLYLEPPPGSPVRVSGHKVKTVRGRDVRHVELAVGSRRTLTVTLVETTSDHRTIRAVARYRRCAKPTARALRGRRG